MEIERKFLVPELPPELEQKLDQYENHEIAQGYISTAPVIRIRRSDDRYILTVKSKGFLARQEFELDITEPEFQELSKKVSGNILSKTRYLIPTEEGYTIELDIFHESFQGLCYAEIEFPNEESAKKYNPPAYFGSEVTFEPAYQNSALSSMDQSLILEFISKIREKHG